MTPVDGTRISPPSARRLVQSSAQFRFSARMSQVASTAGKHGEGRISLEVDKKQHRAAIQGEWWYRGVYAIDPHARGSLLVYQVYNIAPGVSWWLAQVFQGPEHARKMDAQLQQTLLRTIGDQLGCVGELQGDVS
jgi:hypothetical protein